MSEVNLILTVQSTGKSKFRLGLNVNDSSKYFKKIGVDVQLILSKNLIVSTTTTCGLVNFSNEISTTNSTRKKGYDLYDPILNDWIEKNSYHKFKKGVPTKLRFELNTSNFRMKYLRREK